MQFQNAEPTIGDYDDPTGAGAGSAMELSNEFDDSSPSSTEGSTTVVRNDRSKSESPDDPFAVKIELLVVGGLAAEELLKRQATAVREALQWFADNSNERDSDDNT